MSKLYTYTPDEESAKNIEKKGLFAPSQLTGTEYFKDITDNYKARLKKVTKQKPDEELILDYLDYVRGLLSEQFQAGRNMMFALTAPVPQGISKAHDKVTKRPCFEIDAESFWQDNQDAEFILVELPDEKFEKLTPGLLKALAGIDFSDVYDPKTADNLLYAGWPHIAIWTSKGHIPAKYVKRMK